MSKLVVALLTDDNKLEKFEELDMSWVDKFNEQFEKSEIPSTEKTRIYEEELVDMTALALLSQLIPNSNDDIFSVNREHLKHLIRKLFGYELEQEVKSEK